MGLKIMSVLLSGMLLTSIFMVSSVGATSTGVSITGGLAFSDCFGHPSCPDFLNANSGKKVRIQVRASGTPLTGFGTIIPLEGFPFAIGTCSFEVSGQTDGVSVFLPSGVITACSNIDGFVVGQLPVSITANSQTGEITFIWGPLITSQGEIPGFVHTGTGTVIIR